MIESDVVWHVVLSVSGKPMCEHHSKALCVSLPGRLQDSRWANPELQGALAVLKP